MILPRKSQKRAAQDADIDVNHLNSLATIQEKLEYIWEHGPKKIKKDRLIFLLWGEEDGPEERVKLRRALQYFQLKSFQDCYQKLKKIS